jgi:hypothetical protein
MKLPLSASFQGTVLYVEAAPRLFAGPQKFRQIFEMLKVLSLAPAEKIECNPNATARFLLISTWLF